MPKKGNQMLLSNLIILLGAMLLLAIVPGPAVFAVIARSFSSGFLRGLYMTMGIVVGDYIFIVLALFGLSTLAEAMGTTFFIIKYISAAYLVWLGYKLLCSQASSIDIEESKDSSLFSNFMAGLLITLGNPKAILFYVGFFPAFINVSEVTLYDTGLIMLAATLAFGSVNICYALLAIKAKKVFKSPNASSIINKTAGTIMVSTGIIITARG